MVERSGDMERSQLVRVGVGSREVSDQSQASFEQVFWHAAKIPESILRPQTPLSYPSKKTAQSDEPKLR
jgi:hypothetical protein